LTGLTGLTRFSYILYIQNIPSILSKKGNSYTIKLENAGIPYMISGSFGSSLHGEPRATNDIDMIIAPTEVQLNTFIQSLSEGYYVFGRIN